MADAKRRLFSAFRFSRKLALTTGGFLVLLGASGTAALLFSGPVPFLGDSGLIQQASGQCKTVYQAKFTRAGERRLIAIIRAEDTVPEHRIEVGLRLAKHLAETEEPDLVTIQLVDQKGPDSRAELRGPLIGTEIVYAPNPNRSRATGSVWEVRYVDAEPSGFGYYFGERKRLPKTEIANLLDGIETFSGCDGDVIETAQADSADATAAGQH